MARDYGAERARRNARADELGFSHGWAQGHPNKDELSPREYRNIDKGQDHRLIIVEGKDYAGVLLWKDSAGRQHRLPLTEGRLFKLPKVVTDLVEETEEAGVSP